MLFTPLLSFSRHYYHVCVTLSFLRWDFVLFGVFFSLFPVQQSFVISSCFLFTFFFFFLSFFNFPINSLLSYGFLCLLIYFAQTFRFFFFFFLLFVLRSPNHVGSYTSFYLLSSFSLFHSLKTFFLTLPFSSPFPNSLGRCSHVVIVECGGLILCSKRSFSG